MEETMKRTAVLCIVILLAACSCATGKSGKTLTEVRAGLECFRYEKDVPWDAVAESLGQPDMAPLPDSGTDLSKNTRIYTNRIVILSVERQEVSEGKKVRFREVVTGLEVCRER